MIEIGKELLDGGDAEELLAQLEAEKAALEEQMAAKRAELLARLGR